MKKLAKEIWIVGAKRTPFGALSGALKDVSAIDLAVHASKANLVYTLARRKKSLAVGAACIGGGQGIAVVLEAV